jgi:predicted  nucleic acid-binding Zn-ribbon protein
VPETPSTALKLEIIEMARALFAAEQVHEAADGLVAEGKTVTALTLLARLGGGSLTTIYKHLITWRDAKKQDPTPAMAQAVPEPVQAAFATALGRAWAAAAGEAAKEITATKEKAAEEVQTANLQFEEAMQAIERMEEQADTDTAKIESLSARVAELEVALHKSENEKAALNATTEQLRQRVKSQEAELERVHKESDSERRRQQEELDKTRTAAAAAQETAAKQIADLKQSLSDTQRQGERAERDRDDARAQKEKTDQQLQQLDQEIQAARKEKEAAGQEAAQARGQIEALKEQNSELMAKLAERGKQGTKS